MINQFPHCDQRVLHAPGECKYCDLHPEWQELRKSWGIAFTGQAPGRLGASGQTRSYMFEIPEGHWNAKLPCPADFARPAGTGADHRRWAGNVATSQTPVNETDASRMLYGDPWTGDVVVEELPVTSTTAGPKQPKVTWLSFRRKQR